MGEFCCYFLKEILLGNTKERRTGFVKKLKQQEIFYILLFSILITCLFKDGVNALTMLFIPEKNVIVTAKENDCITILQEDSPNGLFSKCREAASDSSWTYFEGVKGESWTSLSSNMEGAFFSFSAKSVPNTYISFLVNGNGGKASIEVSGGGYARRLILIVKNHVDRLKEYTHLKIRI